MQFSTTFFSLLSVVSSALAAPAMSTFADVEVVADKRSVSGWCGVHANINIVVGSSKKVTVKVYDAKQFLLAQLQSLGIIKVANCWAILHGLHR
ncbi:uncharacterized protein JN550_005444 [Neoarthrinium moseri]|uniref:uncharacterized protein n=1 Tax=Neoarthrinium moseri TaxID=1658444 RepID=UPI001FDD46B4|nr:uncharacterized protein JN550_005444 [Neoarthrinium moseri]KAI1869854.1 hypothetical protein JN550_005444 [Neoarthrinium moseri]